ncbi:MAG: hypothetical protein Nkreftii_002029 [Candidatus Nitrospira kreftii]|uniref:DUF5666 domain-containing protein n=1 Tax=Candidatus Nitrospira kreftii TaxID=2652173 RepID=A0A7S8FEB5_9BACT|nr:MAG: hypothetical protein Nkreftii_002029 [Candidatus Nitrospira kreftii]
MSTSRCVYSIVSIIGLAGLLAACGSEATPPVSASGSGNGSGSASASGTITGFGSVFVNGKQFETSGSSFIVDGQSGSQSDLKVGMTVTVNGSFNGTQRSANAVFQKDAVEGLVQSAATDGLSVIVMGQTVLVDNDTLIDNNIPGRNVLNLVTGTDHVEVSGHIRPNGVIQATYIEKKLINVTPEARGFVKNHNDGAKTFQVGDLTVIYTTALINDMPNPSGNSWNGLLVEAKGTVFNAATTTLTATKVEPEHRGIGNQVDEFEVEGYVTQVLGTGNFIIGNTQVQTTGNTEFRGGTIDEIVVGAKLSAEGRWENGLLIAKHVKFHESVRLEGDIETIGTNAFTLTQLPSVTVTVNSQTEFKDTSLNGMSSGDHVRVRGRVSGNNAVVATRIDLRSADNDIDLQGPVQSITGNVITLLGVSVDTSIINQFESVRGTSISRTGFLAAVRVNSLVKVKGKLSGATVVWDEAELED